MKKVLPAAFLLLALGGIAACGYDGGTPTSPSAGPPAGAIVVDILGERGDRSFSPNPATVPAGQIVVWHNTDTQVHRVTLNSGGLDTGNIAPGGYSAPMMLPREGPYHCSIHPSMVGELTLQ